MARPTHPLPPKIRQTRNPLITRDKPIILLGGPTASGKSALAIALAQTLRGEVINADASQFYYEIPIISAAPSREQQAIVPHHLFGFIKGGLVFSAAQFVQAAIPIIKDCWQREVIPIVVGGSGFYFQALRFGLAEIPEIDPEIRQTVRDLQSQGGAEGLYQALRGEDSEAAATLPPRDSQRLARALEVMRSTGKSLLWWQRQATHAPLPEASYFTVCLNPSRSQLAPLLETRLWDMLKRGAVAEALAVDAMKLADDAPLRKAIGVREFMKLAKGDYSQEEAIAAASLVSRRYAKRQQTWFRHQFQADFSWAGDLAHLIPQAKDALVDKFVQAGQ